LIEAIPGALRTQALVDLAAHAAPGGPAQSVLDEANPIKRGQDLVILGDPGSVLGWLRVYVPQTPRGSGGYFTWIPTSDAGQDTISPPQADNCPPTRDNLSVLSHLDPFTRARCLGAGTFTIEARTSPWSQPVWYGVEPAWLGQQPRMQTAALTGPVAEPLDIRFPPGLEQPPQDITVRVEMHVADSASASCTRNALDKDLPLEPRQDARLWCTVQLVVDRWEPILGPEDRPFDAANPQLHRANPSGACAGVDMGQVAFHTNPDRLEPVWLEPAAGGPHIHVWFGPQFRVAFTPDLVVVDAAGKVIARDGLIVNPDGNLAGHAVCPSTNGLFIY